MYHSRSFNSSQAKRTFGRLNEPIEAGDYISNIKEKNMICVGKKYPHLNLRVNKNSFNYSNLNANLITKLQLNSNIPVIQKNSPYTVPTDLSANVVPYLYYTIDPSGVLFGNNVCDINNWKNYVVYNPPTYIQNS